MSTAFQAKASMRLDVKTLSKKNSTAFTLTECLDDNANDVFNSEEESNKESPNEEIEEPEYRKIWSLMDAVGFHMEDSKFVGMRLLYMRAEARDKKYTLTQKRAMDSQSKNDWSTLFSQTEKRSPARRFIIELIRQKYSVESRSRSLWPVCATHEEDMAIRKPKWNDKYTRSQRIVMCDMTNIEAYGFSDANLQRLTYSKYYNQNCFNFKGGVFAQLC